MMRKLCIISFNLMNNKHKFKKTITVSVYIFVVFINVCLCNDTNRTNNEQFDIEYFLKPFNSYSNESAFMIKNEYNKKVKTNESIIKPFISTGNSLWDGLLRECLEKPSFSCIQKNVYSYLDEFLQTTNMNVTNRLFFVKNKLDYRKYSKERNSAKENEIIDDEEIPGKQKSCKRCKILVLPYIYYINKQQVVLSRMENN